MLPTPTKKRGFRVEGDPRPPPKSHPPCLQGLTLRNSLPYCRSDASSCVSGWVVAASYATLCVMGKGTPLPEGHPPTLPPKNRGTPTSHLALELPLPSQGVMLQPGQAPPPSHLRLPGLLPTTPGLCRLQGCGGGGSKLGRGAPPNSPHPSPIDLFLSFFYPFLPVFVLLLDVGGKAAQLWHPRVLLNCCLRAFSLGGHTVWGGWHPQTRPVPLPRALGGGGR